MRKLGLYTAYAGGALSALGIFGAACIYMADWTGVRVYDTAPLHAAIFILTGLALTIIGAALYFGWRGR